MRGPDPAPRREREGGFTLLETTIAMSILLMVLLAVFAAFDSMQRQTLAGEQRLQDLDQARALVDVVSRDIRTAAIPSNATSPFAMAAGNDIAFTANLLSASIASQVELKMDYSDPRSPKLLETITAPGKAPTTRILGQDIANDPTTQPVFAYFDAADTQLLPAVPGTSLSSAQMSQVMSVAVTLQVRTSVHEYLPATTMVNRVALPNVFYANQASPSP